MSLFRRHQRRSGLSAGITIPELLVTAVLIVILGTIVISNVLTSWRSAQASELAVQLAGWLEEISRRPEVSGTSCTVTFTTGTLNSNAVLAQVSPTSCAVQPSFRVTALYGNRPLSVGASTNTVVFTPRQAITSSNDIQVRLAILNQAPVRCVRLSATLGLIRLGRNDATPATTTDDCPAASFDII
jgi:type II secretory pathway pseudopilin PulG